MGREIRNVPPNWEHPKRQVPNHRLGRMEEDYQPMQDEDVESAWKAWQEKYAAWLGGEFEEVRRKHPELNYDAAQPYRAFCAWHNKPPTPEYYRPAWDAASATWVQVYETVSEGTPVSPPFATRAELIDYLVTHGDFWDQKRRAEGVTDYPCGPWDRKAAESFVNAGWAPSMVKIVSPQGTEVKLPRDGGI